MSMSTCSTPSGGPLSPSSRGLQSGAWSERSIESQHIEVKLQPFTVDYSEFLTKVVPLYSGPLITIGIAGLDVKYQVYKSILSSQSSHFRAIFDNSESQSKCEPIEMEPIDTFVNLQSLEMLLQWMYTGRVVLKETELDERITRVLEFLSIANMCRVFGMEEKMAQLLRRIIQYHSNLSSSDNSDSFMAHITKPRGIRFQGKWLNSKHIELAWKLPASHPVRGFLAEVVAEEFLCKAGDRFLREIDDKPHFAADILRAKKKTGYYEER